MIKTTADIAFAAELDAVLGDIRATLLQRREQYGESVFNPLGVYGPKDALGAIGAQIDSKLTRQARGDQKGAKGKDSRRDTLGYLVLYEIQIGREEAKEVPE